MTKQAKAVAKSRAEAGLKSTSFYMTEAERQEIKALAAEMGCSQKDAIIAAVEAYKRQGALSNEALLLELKRRLK